MLGFWLRLWGVGGGLRPQQWLTPQSIGSLSTHSHVRPDAAFTGSTDSCKDVWGFVQSQSHRQAGEITCSFVGSLKSSYLFLKKKSPQSHLL